MKAIRPGDDGLKHNKLLKKLNRAAISTLLVAVLVLLIAPSSAFAAWTGGHDIVGTPAASREWYFAEGTTRQGFEEWICLSNPNNMQTAAAITYMMQDGQEINKNLEVAPLSRTTVDVSLDVPANTDVSVRVTTDLPIVAERPMYFRYMDTMEGGHCVAGETEPGEEYYFAEGTCRPNFEPFICILNPAATDADVQITYMLGDGAQKVSTHTIGAVSRYTVRVKDVLGEGDDAAHDFSATVECTNGGLIVVERPMYFNYNGTWNGGHDVVAAKAPSLEYYFAEGTCRPNFESYICMLNPGAGDVEVKITYMRGDGTQSESTHIIGGLSRDTVRIKDILGEGDDAAHDFSAHVMCLGEDPIVAERPMYFNYGGAWNGGHDVIGATSPGHDFYFAEGTCRPDFESYFCIMNPKSGTAHLKITYMLGDGTRNETVYAVGGNSRYTVRVKDILGEGNDSTHDFSAYIRATGDIPIVVERPMYFSYKSNATWTLAAVGDVNLGGDMCPTLAANGFGYPWTLVSGFLSESTLAFANLECTMSYRGSAIPGKSFTFRGDPAALPFVRDAGVDVVSQANNHARDYGTDAMVDCLAYLDSAGIKHCGAGLDYGSAHAPAYLNANGIRVAFLAYDDIGYAGWAAGPGYPGVALPSDTAQMAADIAEAGRNADFVVTSFHWGTERKYTPDPSQVNYARYAIDCGADLVLGHHPHVVQGFGFYNGKPVANSLGNFIFNPGSGECRYTVLTRYTFSGNGFVSMEAQPYYISNGRPQLMGGAEGLQWISRVAGMSQQQGAPARVDGCVMRIP
ncbi:MAG: CapA family protein [Actinobacteria bacterium]|nr:CapA family protein [Actinomycetota bacterium]